MMTNENDRTSKNENNKSDQISGIVRKKKPCPGCSKSSFDPEKQSTSGKAIKFQLEEEEGKSDTDTSDNDDETERKIEEILSRYYNSLIDLQSDPLNKAGSSSSGNNEECDKRSQAADTGSCEKCSPANKTEVDDSPQLSATDESLVSIARSYGLLSESCPKCDTALKIQPQESEIIPTIEEINPEPEEIPKVEVKVVEEEEEAVEEEEQIVEEEIEPEETEEIVKPNKIPINQRIKGTFKAIHGKLFIQDVKKIEVDPPKTRKYRKRIGDNSPIPSHLSMAEMLKLLPKSGSYTKLIEARFSEKGRMIREQIRRDNEIYQKLCGPSRIGFRMLLKLRAGIGRHVCRHY